MQKFSFKRFLGMNTIKSPTNIPDNMAVDMRDMEIKRGLVRSRNGFLKHNLTGLGARITGIYQFRPKFKYFPPIISQDDTLEVVSHWEWDSFDSASSGGWTISRPLGIDYDINTGYFYIVNRDNLNVVKTKWGGEGWTNSNFPEPLYATGISYDPTTEYIYLTDVKNDRIIKTKLDGTGWVTYGSSGSGVGQFDYPQDIDYDPATGYVYVADKGNARIVKTQIDGTGWTTLSSPAYNYTSIDYDPTTGYIYAGGNEGYVLKTKIDGTGQESVWLVVEIDGINYDHETDFFYANKSVDITTLYPDDDNMVVRGQLGGSYKYLGSDGSGMFQFNAPYGVKYDSVNKYVYVSDSGNDRIVRFSSSLLGG